jgi:predicted kinase
MVGQLLLLTGPAGSGKSTVARVWASKRARGVHIQLDEIRSLIVGGYADPQADGRVQTEQYEVSVLASIALAKQFINHGYDVALCDVFPPALFERLWRPHLEDVEWRVVVLLPTLDETITRATKRTKHVREDIIRDQHAAMTSWNNGRIIDTTTMTVEEALVAVQRLFSESP